MAYTLNTHTNRVEEIPLQDFRMTVIHNGLSVAIHVYASQVKKGFWQWTALGKDGQEVTKEKAIDSARRFIMVGSQQSQTISMKKDN